MNKESEGGKKRPGENQLGKQNLPLHLTSITVTVKITFDDTFFPQMHKTHNFQDS